MSIQPIAGAAWARPAAIDPADAPGAAGAAGAAPAPGFGAALERGLTQVSDLEHHADALVADVATGGPTKVHEVMVATTEASIATDMLVHVRDRALEAYHEVMRLQL